MRECERDQRITILAFEGPDKSGKSTLIKEVNRAANYRFLCIDRFTGSAWVYDKLTGRRDRTSSLVDAEEELSHMGNVVVLNVLLKGDPDILRGRIQSEDEHGGLRLQQLDSAILLYEEYAERVSRLPTIEVDTSNKTIEETVQEILSKIEKYEQDHS